MIKRLSQKDINQVARIHGKELSGFLSDLGASFLEKFYHTSLTLPEMFTYVEKRKGRVVGFVCSIEDSSSLYTKILLKNPLGFFSFFAKYVLKHPFKSIKILKMLSYPGFSEKGPELLSIAVDKRYQKKGIGRKLFEKTAGEFKKRNIDSFKISVYDRLRANGFYQRIKCRKIASFKFLNETMNYYRFSKEKKKLRVILLHYESLYANPVFLPLFKQDFVEIAAIVVSDCILHKKSTLESIMFLYKKQGIKYTVFKIIDQVLYILTAFNKYLPGKKIKRVLWEAEKRDIPILKIKDINNKDSIKLIKGYSPDILISYFNQILRKQILSVPKKGSLNVHPGYLPKYRGVASSLWAMHESEKWGGATVHFMSEKLDKGDIVRRKKVAITGEESLHRHNYLSCKTGGELLIESLQDVYRGNIRREKQRKGSYFSWPNAQAVDKILGKGFKLIEKKDLSLYL